jgi:hypothetical protein
MQVDFDVPAADVAATGIEASNQQAQPEIDNERTVAANGQWNALATRAIS